jgi:hypothetical protein
MHLLLPLASAILYAFAAVALKEAERRGVGAMRITVLSNFALAAAFAAFVPWQDFPHLAPAVWWPVPLAGAAFAVGQAMTIVAFARGEVSVATPTLGTKVLFVTLVAAAFTSSPVHWSTWAAAGLMAEGIWLLVGWPHHTERRRVAYAVGCSLVAALAYAVFDVIVGVWSGTLGFGRLVPASVLAGSVLSLPLLAVGRRDGADVDTLEVAADVAVQPAPRPSPGVPAEEAEGAGCPWLPSLILGLALLSAQSLLLISSIGYFHDAPRANVVYASRGIWSILVVHAIAGAAGEGVRSRGAFMRRLAGAGVMLTGVGLAFWDKQ